MKLNTIYFSNGKPRYEWSYLNGIFHGIEKGFYISGQRWYIEHFKTGRQNGPQIEFNYAN